MSSLARIPSILLIISVLLSAPFFYASAHEVYVLGQEEIDTILRTDSPNPFLAAGAHEIQFFTWGFIVAMIITIVFFVSITRPIEEMLDPILFRLKKKLGFIIVRVTIGLALMASGYYHALFGPELPLADMFGAYTNVASTILIIIGFFILVGLMTRLAGIAALLIAVLGVYHYGTYIFTYSNYIGDIIFVGFLGAHIWSFDKHVLRLHGIIKSAERFAEKFAFLLLRVTFGFSLIYASVFAKFVHSELALRTVLDYNLTNYFHFDPLFIVLGAGIIEVTIGFFIIVGFEVRFASLFLMVFLTLSLVYFGEAVWPHIVLFGGALALFVHGYDRYSIEGYFFKDAGHEPIL